MSDRPNFCENRDGIICDGVNGFKSIVQGFAGDGARTSAPSTSSDSVAPQPTPPPPTSDDTPPPPPPPAPETITTSSPPEIVTVSVTPPASTITSVVIPPPSPPELVSSPSQEPITNSPPQLILPTPAAALTSTSSRGSFIESLPTRTATTLNPVNNPLVPSIFASSDFQSPVVGPVTAFPSQPTETVVATPLVSPGPAEGAITDRSTAFPAALVAGVSGGVIAFIFIFALLWRYYLRKQSQQRDAHSLADENGIIHTREDRHDPSSDRIVTTEIWSGSYPSKSDQTRFSWAATEVSLGTDLEPLSPKPVIQQTVHRMSVPVPVEASSFRNSSKEGSMRGSISRPTSTNHQSVSRDASAPEGGESTRRSSARLQVPGTDHPPKQQDLPSQIEETEDDSEQDLVPAPLQKKEEGTGLQRQYTLRTSPLHQNPFKDPVEEESPTATPASLTFEIVNPDTSPPRSTRESESAAQGEDGPEDPPSPLHVLQTITLTAEDLKRASTARMLLEKHRCFVDFRSVLLKEYHLSGSLHCSLCSRETRSKLLYEVVSGMCDRSTPTTRQDYREAIDRVENTPTEVWFGPRHLVSVFFLIFVLVYIVRLRVLIMQHLMTDDKVYLTQGRSKEVTQKKKGNCSTAASLGQQALAAVI